MAKLTENKKERVDKYSGLITIISDTLKYAVHKRLIKESYLEEYLGVSNKTLKKMMKGNYDFNIGQIVKIEMLINQRVLKVKFEDNFDEKDNED